ncbi:LexA family protein [Enterococcus mediterraneensis]|uniref:LexA family protein n=1 Tax=Enterococcus mediterraneensis TaxID=2364791 RepID=UPI000F06A69D|nr:XRE family transcriptional regulator [Enterococcus mediterraneensis]
MFPENYEAVKYLKQKRKEKRVNQETLGNLLNVTKATISRYESGDIAMNVEDILKVADFLGVNRGELPDLSISQNLFVDETTLKVLGSVKAGYPLECYEVAEDVPVPAWILKKFPNAYGLRVHGDSMDRIIPENTIAVVNPQTEVPNGKIAIVRINGTETTMKKFYNLDGTIILRPESTNPDYRTMSFDTEEEKADIHVEGRVVTFVPDPRIIL